MQTNEFRNTSVLSKVTSCLNKTDVGFSCNIYTMCLMCFEACCEIRNRKRNKDNELTGYSADYSWYLTCLQPEIGPIKFNV